MRTTSGTLPTDYTFTGQKLDASSGLMYYGARYYDAYPAHISLIYVRWSNGFQSWLS